jgi:hypothetical protein
MPAVQVNVFDGCCWRVEYTKTFLDFHSHNRPLLALSFDVVVVVAAVVTLLFTGSTFYQSPNSRVPCSLSITR